jgi:ribosomal protein S1
MKENKKIMPERFCTLDTNMSLEKLIMAQENKIPVVGRVLLWNSQEKNLKVDLGNDIYGFLPIDLASIYPSSLDNGDLTSSIRAIIGKPILTIIEQVSFNGEGTMIKLNRKILMLDAFNFVSNSIGKTVECCVTGIVAFGVFVDVGNGLSGLIHHKDLCIPRLKDFRELGFDVGDKITAKIIDVNDNFQISLNYKDQFENMALTTNRNDLVIATILKQHNNDGFFGCTNPNTPVLIDIPSDVNCYYGDKILARAKAPKKKHPDKLNLVFHSFVK